MSIKQMLGIYPNKVRLFVQHSNKLTALIYFQNPEKILNENISV